MKIINRLSALICVLTVSVALSACSDNDSSAETAQTTAATTAATTAEEIPQPEGEVVYKGKLGGDRKYSIYEDGTLVINGTGDIKDYNSSACPFRNISYEIKRAIISNGITRIGSWAFYRCETLTSISIPSSVTSIGDHAFGGCAKLTAVTIPEGVTEIDNYAFVFCYDLNSVGLPNSLSTIAENAFQDCTSLTEITIPSGVKSIGAHAFLNCSELTSITIPGSVKDIGEYAVGFYETDRGGEFKKYDKLTIKGEFGSAAEKYAEDNGFKFVAI